VIKAEDIMNRFALLSLVPLLGLLAACNTDPKAASRRYVDNGKKYFDRGKYTQASIMYRRALQKDSRNGEAWYRLGLTNISAKNYNEARRDFERASELETTPGPVRLEAYSKLGDLDFLFHTQFPNVKDFALELKDVSEKLLKQDPKSFDGLRLAGYSAFAERQVAKDPAEAAQRLKEAMQRFQDANAVKPYNPEVVSMLTQLLFGNNQAAEAEKLGKDLIERDKNYDRMYDILYSYYLRTNRAQEAEQLLKKKIANNPARGEFVTQLAFFYFLTQRKPDMQSTLSQLTSDKKKFPGGHLLVGDFYYTIRDYDHAIAQYREGEKDDPNQKFTYQKKLVEALTVSGKSDEAAKVVAELIREHPKDPEAIAMHASVLLQGAKSSKQADGIIAELQPLVAKTATNEAERLAILHFNLARAYTLKGDPASLDQARLHFQETLKIRPNYIPAKLALAQLELRRGDTPQAIQHAAEVLALDKNNLTAKLVRTLGLMSVGDYDQSRSELNELVKSDPRSNDVRFQMGRLNYLQRRYPEAEADFQMLADAKDPRGLNGIIECKVARGQYDDAIRLVQAEVAKAPDNLGYRMVLASLDTAVKKYPEAIHEFQTVIDKSDKSPDLPALYLRMGEAKRMSGDTNGAIAIFNKARDLSPKDPIPLLQLALVYEFTGRGDEARKMYEQVLKLQPDNTVALNNIAYAKADEGVDLDTALNFAERARNKKPDDPNVLDTVSLIFLKKNLTDDGLRLLRELVTRVPNNPTYHLHFALGLYQKGDKAEAKRELQTAMRFNPTGREQQKIRELMAKIG